MNAIYRYRSIQGDFYTFFSSCAAADRAARLCSPRGSLAVAPRTRRRAALASLADRYAALAANKGATVGIAHADDPEGAKMLLEMLKERGFCGQDITVCYEPVTGAHVGPGAVALFFEGPHK